MRKRSSWMGREVGRTCGALGLRPAQLCAVVSALVGCADGSAAVQETLADSTLRRLVAEIQPDVERRSGLEARAPLNVALSTQERLRSYLMEQLDAQLTPELAAAVTAVYARLGLVPDTLDLHAMLVELYQEQVVGYYDPKTDTLFVQEIVGAAELETVLAHELVHALQDQHVDLDSLVQAVGDQNDRSTAVQAAIEGHATLAMMEWRVSRMLNRDVDVTELPDLGEQFQGVDLAALGEGSLPALSSAPRVIQEALVFPYIGGLVFLQRLWIARPERPVPFGSDLPASTEQVLHPDRFAEPRDEPIVLRFTDSMEPVEVPETSSDGWGEVRSDDMGELETRIFLEEHLDDDSRAAEAASGWNGDRYRLVRGPPGEVFLWVLGWDSSADADEFAEAARDAFARRYDGTTGRRVTVDRIEVERVPAVRIIDSPADFSPPDGWLEVALEHDGR